MSYRKYDTCFFERYAMLQLQSVLGHKFDNLVNKDRPDLQSADGLSLGIEVTRAMEGGRKAALQMLKDISGITGDSEDRLDDFALYDALMTNDVINLVVNAMDEDEYTSLFTMVEELSNSVAEYKQSVAGMLNNLIQIIPEQASKLQEAIENTDKDKLVAMADVMKNKD